MSLSLWQAEHPPFAGVLEERQAAGLGGGEPGLAADVVVVLRRERGHRRAEEVRGHRVAARPERRLRVVEGDAEFRVELRGVRRRADLRGDPVGALAVHLVGIQQGLADELRERVDATVPEKAAVHVDERRVLFPVGMKPADVLEIEDRRRIPLRVVAGPAPERDADRRAMVSREAARRIMTARAARPRRARTGSRRRRSPDRWRCGARSPARRSLGPSAVVGVAARTDQRRRRDDLRGSLCRGRRRPRRREAGDEQRRGRRTGRDDRALPHTSQSGLADALAHDSRVLSRAPERSRLLPIERGGRTTPQMAATCRRRKCCVGGRRSRRLSARRSLRSWPGRPGARPAACRGGGRGGHRALRRRPRGPVRREGAAAAPCPAGSLERLTSTT